VGLILKTRFFEATSAGLSAEGLGSASVAGLGASVAVGGWRTLNFTPPLCSGSWLMGFCKETNILFF
jgi:hypothetical protein